MANYDSTHTGATIDSAVSQVTDSTTDFNVDSNTLVVDKSANSVGIGTAAPTTKFEVYDDSAGADFTTVEYDYNTKNRKLRFGIASGNPSIQGTLTDNSATSLAINAGGGNVGIGTDSPDYLLELEAADAPAILSLHRGETGNLGDGESIGEIVFRGEDTGHAASLNGAIIRAVGDADWAGADNADDAPSRLEFYTQSDGSGDGMTAPRMTIDSSGNVGIGNAAPATGLVVGTTNYTFSGTTYDIYGLFGDTSGGIRLGADSSNDDSAIGTTGTNNLQFVTYDGSAWGSRMTLTNTGNVGINETSPAHTLEVGGDIGVAGNYIVNEQGRTDHVANTMPAPYYRFDGVDDLHSLNALAVVLNGAVEVSLVWRGRLQDLTSDNKAMIAFMNAGLTEFIYIDTDASNGKLRGRGTKAGSHKWIFSTDNTYSTNTEMSIVFTHDGTTPLLYVNGILQDLTYTSEADKTFWFGDTTLLTTGRLGCLYNGSDINFLNQEVSHFSAYNIALSATEVKELYSGASVPFKYKGANQTEMVTNGDFATGDATGWNNHGEYAVTSNELVATNADTARAATSTSAVIVAGKTYRLIYDISAYTSGTIKPYYGDIAGTYVSLTSRTAADTDITEEFTATVSGNFGFHGQTGSSANLSLDNISLVPIGAVAEYDGSSATGGFWYDKSGNDLDGTVSGATLENKLDTIQTSGITFPATAHDSSNANTLDDYEEGTWTVVVADASSAGNTGNHSGGVGYYTKIGRVVHYYIQITAIDTTGLTAGNDFYIRGLPFTASKGEVGAVWMEAVTFSGNPSFIIEASNTVGRIGETSTGASLDRVMVSEITDDSGAICVSGTYYV